MKQILLYHQEWFIPEKSILQIQNKKFSFHDSDFVISPRMIQSIKHASYWYRIKNFHDSDFHSQNKKKASYWYSIKNFHESDFMHWIDHKCWLFDICHHKLSSLSMACNCKSSFPSTTSSNPKSSSNPVKKDDLITFVVGGGGGFITNVHWILYLHYHLCANMCILQKKNCLFFNLHFNL